MILRCILVYHQHQNRDNDIKSKNEPNKETDGKPPGCPPEVVAEQLPIADVVVQRNKENGNPVANTDSEGDNKHQGAHENLNEDVFGEG